jgi:hypothetical protein
MVPSFSHWDSPSFSWPLVDEQAPSTQHSLLSTWQDLLRLPGRTRFRSGRLLGGENQEPDLSDLEQAASLFMSQSLPLPPSLPG